MEPMSQERKRQIRDLMRQKISLEDQIQFESNREKIQRLEDDLYDVKDTLDKLTNGVWFEDVSEQELQRERESLNWWPTGISDYGQVEWRTPTILWDPTESRLYIKLSRPCSKNWRKKAWSAWLPA
jgi:hypothetical protein